MDNLLEKTIQGLECCLIPFKNCHEKGCPYYENVGCKIRLKDDALALLKVQEPKKVRCIVKLTKVMKGICPTCEMMISSVLPYGKITKFCQYCGQAVKWE